VTQEQFETACGKTLRLVKQIGRERGASEQGMQAERYTQDPTAWRHMNWMLVQAALFHFEGKKEKAHRWLGFVQGVLCMCGVQLDELKLANMPEGEAYDPEKV
jgi:hypothetical protein